MRVMKLGLACLVVVALSAATALAQEGYPLKGSWLGDYGPNKTTRTQVFLVMDWDGKAISGMINPGTDNIPIKNATLTPPTPAPPRGGGGGARGGGGAAAVVAVGGMVVVVLPVVRLPVVRLLRQPRRRLRRRPRPRQLRRGRYNLTGSSMPRLKARTARELPFAM